MTDLQKPKLPKNVIKCVEAVAHILRKMQKPLNKDKIADLISEKVSSHHESITDPSPELEEMQITISKMADTISEIKQTVDIIKTTSNKVDETVNKITACNRKNDGNVPMTYKNALMGTSIASHLDPRIHAKEGIKTRQIKISISTQAQIANLSDTILIEWMNKVLDKGQKIY